jgi:peptidoglycan/LPS O-acetylase OafA/YrhL
MHYKFVDFVRFWSVLAIVMLHSLIAFYNGYTSISITNLFFISAFKFGTLCFFIISGFLLGDKLYTTSPTSYLLRRFKTLFKPYLFALTLYIIWISFSLFFKSSILYSPHLTLLTYLGKIVWILEDTLLHGPYWFVLNLLFSLTVIILLKDHHFKIWFSVLMCLLVITYALNVHLVYFNPTHTIALFAYLPYLWFGVLLNKNKALLYKIVSRFPLKVFIGVSFLLCIVSVIESNYLSHYSFADPFNTLKITNQLYSISIFVLLIKLSRYKLPAFLNPRREAYGIYLYHMFFITACTHAVKLMSLWHPQLPPSIAVNLLSVKLFVFVLSYIAVTFMVKVISRSSFSWIVGVTPISVHLNANSEQSQESDCEMLYKFIPQPSANSLTSV